MYKADREHEVTPPPLHAQGGKGIDLNCDMGELPELAADGTQEALMTFVTSVNIACGGHAGDERLMTLTVRQAIRNHVAIGAHPGYADREHFGRRALSMPPEVVSQIVFDQVHALAAIAANEGAQIRHVKAHGALYHQAEHDLGLATAIAEGVARWSRDVVLVGSAGSPMLDAFREAGFRVAAEAFADRCYEADGRLRSRSTPGAILEDPNAAAEQALRIVERSSVICATGAELPMQADTLAIHGDGTGSAAIAQTVARILRDHGVQLRPL